MLHAKVSKFSYVVFIFSYAMLAMAQPIPPLPNVPPTPTPYVMPTALPTTDPSVIPQNDVVGFLQTAVANVNAAPADLAGGYVPDETANQLFGYAKWMFSDASARELLGNSLAPIGMNVYILLGLTLFIGGAYASIRIGVLFIRFAQHLLRWIMEFIPG